MTSAATALTDRLAGIGRWVGDALQFVGGVSLTIRRGLTWFVRVLFRRSDIERRNYARELERAGVDSVGIVSLLCVAVGVILAMQTAYQLRKFGAEIYIPALVAIVMAREMGPLLASVILTGRVGAAIAAEIGTMVVSEEIDALRTLGISPYRFLVAPRLFALLVMVPTLSFLATLVGIAGGFAFAVPVLHLTPEYYISETFNNLLVKDLVPGMVKAVVFGQLFGAIACYEGLTVTGGAEGVGKATTRAVVRGIIAIILADAVFTTLFFFLWP